MLTTHDVTMIYIYLYHDEATLQSFRLGYISATVIY